MHTLVLSETLVGSKILHERTGESVFASEGEDGVVAVRCVVPRRVTMGSRDFPHVVTRRCIEDVVRCDVSSDGETTLTLRLFPCGLAALYALMDYDAIARRLQIAKLQSSQEVPTTEVTLRWDTVARFQSLPVLQFKTKMRTEDSCVLHRQLFGATMDNNTITVTFVMSRATTDTLHRVITADPFFSAQSVTHDGFTFSTNVPLVLDE